MVFSAEFSQLVSNRVFHCRNSFYRIEIEPILACQSENDVTIVKPDVTILMTVITVKVLALWTVHINIQTI